MPACTAGLNDLANVSDGAGKIAGCWQGLWHGIITPVTFVISLLKREVSIYEVHNNGGWLLRLPGGCLHHLWWQRGETLTEKVSQEMLL